MLGPGRTLKEVFPDQRMVTNKNRPKAILCPWALPICFYEEERRKIIPSQQFKE